MAVNITSALTSTPSQVLPQKSAALAVTISSDAPPETATLTFTLTDLEYTFVETGTRQLVRQSIASASTPFSTPYALQGPQGPRQVQIDLEVMPNNPPSRSGTAVVIRQTMMNRLMTFLRIR